MIEKKLYDLRNRVKEVLEELDLLIGQAPEKPKQKRETKTQKYLKQINTGTWRKPKSKAA